MPQNHFAPLFAGTVLGPKADEPKRAKTKLVAVFPGGDKRPIVKQRKLYTCGRLDGEVEANSKLRDLTAFLEADFPGVRFERRPA